MDFDTKNNEEVLEGNGADEEKAKRRRRTPSKFGNYYEREDVDSVIEGTEKETEEIEEDDDSDEDPSWVQLFGARLIFVRQQRKRQQSKVTAFTAC
jgi:hypothetical protein